MTTVAPITDIVRAIVGEDAQVEGIVPEGRNSHTFAPSPSHAALLADADLVLANGLFLEDPTIELARATVATGVPIVLLGDTVLDPDELAFDFSFPESGGRPNPHLWTDPLSMRAYVDVIEREVVALRPALAASVGARAERYRERLEALDTAIAAAWETVPAGDRRLLTYHDSWPYFARRYGVTVLGAIQPADFSEPSLSEVRALIDQIRTFGVPAIFGSEVFPSDVLQQIATETGATYVDDLRDDELPGEPGEDVHSYLGMMVSNVRSMVSALGGDPVALDDFDVAS